MDMGLGTVGRLPDLWGYPPCQDQGAHDIGAVFLDIALDRQSVSLLPIVLVVVVVLVLGFPLSPTIRTYPNLSQHNIFSHSLKARVGPEKNQIFPQFSTDLHHRLA